MLSLSFMSREGWTWKNKGKLVMIIVILHIYLVRGDKLEKNYTEDDIVSFLIFGYIWLLFG